MKLYITVGAFPELNQQGGPHQEHISKKKQQEVAHKFLLHTHVAEAHAWLFNSSYGTRPFVYPHVIGITLTWSSLYSRVNQHNFKLLMCDHTCNYAENHE